MQGDDAAGLAAAVFEGDEQVAVLRDREVPRRADVVGHDQRAKPVGEFHAAVIRVARAGVAPSPAYADGETRSSGIDEHRRR